MQPNEGDEDYQFIMGLSNAEAENDLKNIYDSLKLLRALTSSRLKNLANEQELRKVQERNKILTSKLDEKPCQVPVLTGLDGKTFGIRRIELLRMCKNIMKPYGIPMYEFSLSWADGHAFCAFIHSFRPDLIDEKYLKWTNAEETLSYVKCVANSIGAEFDGDFLQQMRRIRPDFVKTYNSVLQLYTCLNV